MPSDYENETCEGCVHLELDACGNQNNWVDSPNVGGAPLRPSVYDDSEGCLYFTPSLECRKVRALERIARLGKKWRTSNDV